MKTIILRLLILSLFCLTANSATYYVSTTGTDGGAGTIGDPLSITKALSSTSPATSGDTILILGGTYTGTTFVSELRADPGNPITVKANPGDRVTLSGTGNVNVLDIEATGSNCVYQALEIYNRDPDRVPWRGNGISVEGNGTEIVNCVIHDCGVGIGSSKDCTNTVTYGNVIYYNGWQDEPPDRGHGHGIYMQNSSGLKILDSNLVFWNMGFGIHFNRDTGTIINLLLRNNVSWDSGAITTPIENNNDSYIFDSSDYLDNVTLTNNFAYHKFVAYNGVLMELGADAGNGTAILLNNFFANGYTTLNDWTTLTVTGNTFMRTPANSFLNINWTTTNAWTWDSNTYWMDEGSADEFYLNGATHVNFGTWQSTYGFDAAGTHYSTDKPATNNIFVLPNSYEAGRAYVVAYNWSGGDNVTANLSGILTTGRRYRVRDVQNYWSPLSTNVFGGSTITLPMTNLVAAAPLTVSAPSVSSPEFTVFVVEQLTGSTGTTLRNLRVSNAVIR